jgi:hypothetical protein
MINLIKIDIECQICFENFIKLTNKQFDKFLKITKKYYLKHLKMIIVAVVTKIDLSV